MVGSGRLVRDVEEVAKVKPERGSELGASVRCDNRRNAKSGNPGMNEGGSTVGGGSGRERNCFRPAISTVYDS